MTDTALALRARCGDRLACETLVRRYEGFAHHLAGEFFIQGGERADAFAEAMHGLAKALQDWKPEGGSAFKVFAFMCMKRQVQTAVKAADRRKHHPLSDAKRLSAPVVDTATEGETVLGDLLPDPQASDPHELVERREHIAEVIDLVGRLSPKERLVVDVLASGVSYEQTSERTGMDTKSVDNALQRARRKYSEAVAA